MSDVNIVVIVGRLVEKPIVKYSASGTAVTNIRVANNVYQGADKKEKVNWFTVVVFGKQAENCEKYLDKGRQIVVNGRLDWSSWETKEGEKRSTIKIIANRIQFIGGRPDSSQSDQETIQEPSEPSKPLESSSIETPPENNMSTSETSSDFDSTFESPIDDTDDIPF